MQYLVSRFLKDQSGATAIEYGLIAAGISVAIIAVVNGLGTKLTDTFGNVKNEMKQALTGLLGTAPARPGLFRLCDVH
jgi:pilus assembly protein Flp/PilA